MALKITKTPIGNGNGTRPTWAAILGKWDTSETRQSFLGEGLPAASRGQSFPIGLIVSSEAMQNGICRARIRFHGDFGGEEQAAGIVLGYRSQEQHYIFAELGAAQSAYSIGEYVSGFGWRPLKTAGQLGNLRSGRDYLLQVSLAGQELKVSVDNVPVIQHLLPQPLEGHQVGLIAAGSKKVDFTDFSVSKSKPKAFVAMQYAEPYNTFYREVIESQAKASGFEVIRIDEMPGPGVIFQDMQREIEQAEVVIAEITPANPNVFYELGYAHALGKPTILLARRDETKLPFDISSFRVVFYNDTIGGKAEVERNLHKHLEAVAGR